MLLKPLLVPKVWGGRRLLSQLYPEREAEFAPDERIGESWALADHADGASTVANGAGAGRRFGDLVREQPMAMVGRPWAERFPLLIKFIDAEEHLSVQVHPNDRQAAAMTAGDRGKTECWFVMDARPGTRVQHGLIPGSDASALRRALERKSLDDVLAYAPAEPGMFLELPAGLVHALMGGTMICEIQQNSNTTYRLYDWDRKPARPLHIEESLAVIDWAPRVPATPVKLRPAPVQGSRLTLLVRNEFFQVAAMQVAPGKSFELCKRPGESIACMVAGGRGRVISEAHVGEEHALVTGQTWFLPAALQDVRLEAGNEPLTLLLAQSLEL